MDDVLAVLCSGTNFFVLPFWGKYFLNSDFLSFDNFKYVYCLIKKRFITFYHYENFRGEELLAYIPDYVNIGKDRYFRYSSVMTLGEKLSINHALIS